MDDKQPDSQLVVILITADLIIEQEGEKQYNGAEKRRGQTQIQDFQAKQPTDFVVSAL